MLLKDNTTIWLCHTASEPAYEQYPNPETTLHLRGLCIETCRNRSTLTQKNAGVFSKMLPKFCEQNHQSYFVKRPNTYFLV